MTVVMVAGAPFLLELVQEGGFALPNRSLIISAVAVVGAIAGTWSGGPVAAALGAIESPVRAGLRPVPTGR